MSRSGPVQAQQAIEALARLDAAYSHGAEMPWGDLGIVLEFARERADAGTGDIHGQARLRIGEALILPGVGVEVRNLGVQGGSVTLGYAAPAPAAEPEPEPPAGGCRTCGRPLTPDHDASAPGPTVRHPFAPTWPSTPGVRAAGEG